MNTYPNKRIILLAARVLLRSIRLSGINFAHLINLFCVKINGKLPAINGNGSVADPGGVQQARAPSNVLSELYVFFVF